jgi:hypothetical protein
MQLSYGEQFQIARHACAAAKQACLGDLKPKPQPKSNDFLIILQIFISFMIGTLHELIAAMEVLGSQQMGTIYN